MPKFEDKRPARSQAYQYLICEIQVEDKYLALYDNSRSIESHLNPYLYNEDYLELEDKLKSKTWNLIDKICTKRQLEILKLTIDGYGQQEIAKILGCNQSSVTKSLNGNKSYYDRKGRHVNKSYGGSLKKIRKAISEDKEIQDILLAMNEILEERL